MVVVAAPTRIVVPTIEKLGILSDVFQSMATMGLFLDYHSWSTDIYQRRKSIAYY